MVIWRVRFVQFLLLVGDPESFEKSKNNFQLRMSQIDQELRWVITHLLGQIKGFSSHPLIHHLTWSDHFQTPGRSQVWLSKFVSPIEWFGVDKIKKSSLWFLRVMNSTARFHLFEWGWVASFIFLKFNSSLLKGLLLLNFGRVPWVLREVVEWIQRPLQLRSCFCRWHLQARNPEGWPNRNAGIRSSFYGPMY